ncbi:hypothetical protein BCR44DRAFT_1426157 [Catenaria anguillulae PL171]|uniref:Uncharacterized protein n=1 Tax=Catenaria anguillulae PL171 TaxID=765915 RepID=A0A1Y2HZL7_9FUNG|nr:hypothetical protein BCR44DRAFT_1426157 [Catenaria anguillulae PL171]
MSSSPLMRRPASAPLLSPTSAAAAAATANPSVTPGHRLPMPSPWHRETASAGFAFSPSSSSSAYESAPYSVSSTRSSTGSKYMDELLFLDPYFQSQKHHAHPVPVAQAVEGQAYQGHAGPRSPLNPFAG